MFSRKHSVLLTMVLFTIWNGASIIRCTFTRVLDACLLNPAPGIQLGRYFTESHKTYDVLQRLSRFKLELGHLHAGLWHMAFLVSRLSENQSNQAYKKSTSIDPGLPELTVSVAASSARRTYNSSTELTVCPYAIFMIVAAENLQRTKARKVSFLPSRAPCCFFEIGEPPHVAHEGIR